MDGPGWPLSTSREMVSTTHADAGLMPALKLLQSLVFPVFHPSGTTSANPLSASRYASAATGRPPGAQKRNQNHPAAAPMRPIVFTMPFLRAVRDHMLALRAFHTATTGPGRTG